MDSETKEEVLQVAETVALKAQGMAGVTAPLGNPTAGSVQQQQAVMADEALLLDTKAGLEDALKLPSFQLNVRNQNTNRYLIVILIAQLVTNIALIGILWTKLG